MQISNLPRAQDRTRQPLAAEEQVPDDVLVELAKASYVNIVKGEPALIATIAAHLPDICGQLIALRALDKIAPRTIAPQRAPQSGAEEIADLRSEDALQDFQRSFSDFKPAGAL